MFKKRGHKDQSRNTRRKRDEDDDDDDDQPDCTNDFELQTLLVTTKQRRTLIHQIQYKRGVDAHVLLHGNQVNLIDDSKDIINNLAEGAASSAGTTTSNLSTRADALSTKTQLSGSTIVAEEQRIWDQKHAAAMEEYVQLKLQQTLSQKTSANGSVVDSATEEEQHHSTNNNTSTTASTSTKERLSRDIAVHAAKTVSTSESDATAERKGVLPPARDDSSTDVLTAGAATAIMEVILPIDDRLQAVTATARAAVSTATIATQQSMPYVRNKSSAVPHRFRSSYNHHHPMVNNNGTNKRPFEHNNRSATESSALSSSVDHDRPGFAAARQLQQQRPNQAGTTSNRNHHNNNNNSNHTYSRSTDDRVYQQFIKRQREQHGR